jgi:galactose-1-phosphate uridylyltransferase
VRTFLIGYEMVGEPRRDVTPEAAARRREQSQVHSRAAGRDA